MHRNILCSVLVLAAAAAPALAQAKNPSNPCGGKAANPCNPCGGKMAVPKVPSVNPCHAKFGQVFYFADSMERNQVTFTSSAPLEDIVGTTNQVVGYVAFDPKDPRKGVQGQFKVAVKDLDTGIPLRDEHLASKMWLDAQSYPDITFTIESAKQIYTLKNSPEYQTYRMTLVGPLSIHGRTRQVAIPARITYLLGSEKTKMKLPGNLVGVRAEFEVALADFDITGPEGMDLIGAKVGETVALEVSAFGSDRMPTAGNPCNPCGGKGKNPCGGKESRTHARR